MSEQRFIDSDGNATSIKWEKPGKPIHLIRNMCDSCAVWCESRAFYDEGACESPLECTCDDCLLSVLDLAEEVRERRGELLAAKEQPRCECRPGSHPARENYLKGAAERDGAICKLGWPL